MFKIIESLTDVDIPYTRQTELHIAHYAMCHSKWNAMSDSDVDTV